MHKWKWRRKKLLNPKHVLCEIGTASPLDTCGFYLHGFTLSELGLIGIENSKSAYFEDPKYIENSSYTICRGTKMRVSRGLAVFTC